jgi:hypothetical protein
MSYCNHCAFPILCREEWNTDYRGKYRQFPVCKRPACQAYYDALPPERKDPHYMVAEEEEEEEGDYNSLSDSDEVDAINIQENLAIQPDQTPEERERIEMAYAKMRAGSSHGSAGTGVYYNMCD